MLGTKGAKSAKTDAAIEDKEEEEPEKAEDGYKRYYGRLTGSLTSYGNQIDKTEIQLKSVKNAKLNAEHEEQREERIKSLEKALVASKKTKSQWMEKIGSLATSLEEGLGEETAWAKVEDVKNLQKELDQEVTALRKNLLAQKQLWSQIPQSAWKSFAKDADSQKDAACKGYLFSLQRLSPSRQENSCTRPKRSCFATGKPTKWKVVVMETPKM